MTCQHCEKAIPIHRIVKDRNYCCPEHRSAHLEQLHRSGLARLMRDTPGPNPDPTAIRRLGPQDDALQAALSAGPADPGSNIETQVPAPPSLGPGQVLSAPATAPPANPTPVRAARAPRAAVLRRAAVCFGLCLALVPLLAVTVVAYSPAGRVSTPEPSFQEKIRQALRQRSTVDLTEDFGDDLQRWAGSAGLPQGWANDSAGSARPGELALYIKSIPLSDYRMEFRGLIERQSLSFVYRAMDFDNYYAASITVVKPGPIPEVALERYAVIDGKAGPRTRVRLPFSVLGDTLYNVQVQAQGNQFVIRINDQFIDSFTDSRLPSGGVGFFSGSGESARICSLRIVDRDDPLGKMCAMFTSRFDY